MGFIESIITGFFTVKPVDNEDKVINLKEEETAQDVVSLEQTPTQSFFTEEELKCKCGCNTYNTEEEFLARLNIARGIAGKPWKVTSGCRCKEHNKAVGGTANSAHLKGLAVDIAAPIGTKKFEIIKAALESGFTRIGVGSNFVHIDGDVSKPQNTLWLY